MKTSLEHLPDYHQERLRKITEEIVDYVPACEMVILFGSYARGDYVEYDVRQDFDYITTFRSDYDIMVLLAPKCDTRIMEAKLYRVKDLLGKYETSYSPVIKIIHDKIGFVNEMLRDGQYFYSDVVEEGVLLYDSKRFKLAKRERMKPGKYKKIAQDYYDYRMRKCGVYLEDVARHYEKGEYTHPSFYLHQATEHLYHAVTLVFSLRKEKEHNLMTLREKTSMHSQKPLAAFPLHTKEEQRLFQLLCDAYIESRYNSKFVVTKEDLDALIPCVNRLREIVEEICTAKIAAIGDE